ncbi:hypothetical protein ACPWSR_16805 [Alloiococcus sp. CFN-8]|uniref:hypothetical protein n=1 Tax=Alloiococcus sp. CFN-8 TaxID=3416081 RepID=UPI003CE70B4E
MRKIIRKNDSRLSRENLCNPFPNSTLQKRLISSGVIDYKDNCILEDLGNGYVKISAKDNSKRLR